VFTNVCVFSSQDAKSVLDRGSKEATPQKKTLKHSKKTYKYLAQVQDTSQEVPKQRRLKNKEVG
jgi:hypothetical protein